MKIFLGFAIGALAGLGLIEAGAASALSAAVGVPSPEAVVGIGASVAGAASAFVAGKRSDKKEL